MGVEENDDESVNLLQVQREVAEEKPIEQVFSQEAEDINTVEPSIESEVQEGIGETAKFEQETETPKVEPKPLPDKVRKLKATRNTPNKSNKSISRIQDDLRKHINARRETDFAILNIRQGLRDLQLVYQITIKDLRKQVSQMHRKIATIDSSKKSARVKTIAKKTTLKKKTSSSKQPKMKSGQNKRRKR